MWTFSYRYSNGSFEWCQSGRRFALWQQAWQAAGEWAYTNHMDETPIEVRLVLVSE